MWARRVSSPSERKDNVRGCVLRNAAEKTHVDATAGRRSRDVGVLAGARVNRAVRVRREALADKSWRVRRPQAVRAQRVRRTPPRTARTASVARASRAQAQPA